MRKYNRAYLDDSGTKVKLCGRCDTTFPYTVEYFGSRGKYGMSAYCIKCTLEVAKKSKIKNRTRKGEYKPRFKFLAFEREGEYYKVCNKCRKELPHTFEFFDSNFTGQRDLQAICRVCRLENNHTSSEVNWARTLYDHARNSSKRRNMQFSITVADILELYNKQNGRCYWTGVTLVPSRKVKYPLQPSLDRLDINEGYVKSNIVLCCFVANMGRNTNSELEFKDFLLTLRKGLDYSLWEN